MASTKKDFCIIGMGRFGETIADSLIKEGHSVIAIDCDREKINKISDKVSFASTLDATNPEALKNIGVKDVEHIIVAIGENIKDSIMTCAALIEIGVLDSETKITAKASNERHARVLEKLGIRDIVRPEKEIGSNTALRLMGSTKNSSIKKSIYLSKELSLYKIKIISEKIDGKTLEEIKLLNLFDNVLFVAVIEEEGTNKTKTMIPNGGTIINIGDWVWIAVRPANIGSILDTLHAQSKK